MLKKENNYDFRKRLCSPHHRVYRPKNLIKKDDEYEIKNGVKIALLDKTEVCLVAVKDFIRYLKTAFSITASLVDGVADITAKIAPNELDGNAEGYMGRKTVVCDNSIQITAFDERGLAQAFYALEEKMNTLKAPYLTKGKYLERPLFSPRMVHSGYGVDEFPNDYLSVCAHAGYDAILVYVKDSHHSAVGECDFNDLVKRASKYGIDVYAYSFLSNFTHPGDKDAEQIYDSVYGELFKTTPGFKGIIFVGESIEFASKDSHVAPRHNWEMDPSGIPDGKPSPGWWPCYDYPEWIDLVKKSIRKYNPTADIVFWTYNFGAVAEQERVKLIKSLPTDISLLVTFEMFQNYPMGDGEGQIMDYTISRANAGDYFLSEAKVAKERGIRLYSQVNTCGRTWDFGVSPYEPFPYQWNERHKHIIQAQKEFGLCGLMESHHMGFLPSFISRIAKNNYTLGGISFEDKLLQIAKEYAGEDYAKFIDAMKVINDAITHYVPSDENQYGPFRVGPAYPLCLIRECKLPNDQGAIFGNAIYYVHHHNHDPAGVHDPYSLRIRAEIKEETLCVKALSKGVSILKTVKNKSTDLQRLINLLKFLQKCFITAIHDKEFHIERCKLLCASTKEQIKKVVLKIERIAKAELENVQKTIPIVEKDSSLGFEPSMLYQCDRKALEWKIKHLNYMTEVELNLYRRAFDESLKGKQFNPR